MAGEYGTIPYKSMSQKTEPRTPGKCFSFARSLIDFSNLFKAFIGTGYLSMAFGFHQAGFVLGTLTLLLVAVIATHCCQLILKCKRYAVQMIVFGADCDIEDINNEESLPDEVREKIKRVERNVSYANIGTLAFGKWGGHIVDINVFITQMGFCVNYFIFIGNQIESLFPSVVRNSTSSVSIISSSVDVNLTPNSTEMIPVTESPVPPVLTYISSSPSAIILCLMPFPVFLLTSIVRHIRGIGPITILANVCLMTGYFTIVGLILRDLFLGGIFDLGNLSLANWATLPVFFGMVTNAYEGVGVVIPFETAMTGNRKNFPFYLFVTMVTITGMLLSCATVGYLDFGQNVQQIILQSLDTNSILVKLVIVMLIVSVLFTYPLQMYPCVEIAERALFAEGRIFGPAAGEKKFCEKQKNELNGFSTSGESVHVTRSSNSGVDSEKGKLLRSFNEDTDFLRTSASGPTDCKMAVGVPESVPAWKRNVSRLLLVTFTLGIAILFFDAFAYFNSFVGALSSTSLAFILPALFHLRLRRAQGMPRNVVAKDTFIILFGLIGGTITIIVVLTELIVKFTS